MLIKATAINGLYSARAYWLVDNVNNIVTRFKETSAHPDQSIVDEVCEITRRIVGNQPSSGGPLGEESGEKTRTRKFKSFTSKYFHFFVDPDEFLIYDSFAFEALKKELGRKRKTTGDFKYIDFVEDMETLRSRIGCDVTWQELDKFLFLRGNMTEYRKDKYGVSGETPPISQELRDLFRDPINKENLDRICEGFVLEPERFQ